MNDLKACEKICAFVVQNECDIDDPAPELKQDCEQACLAASDYSGGNNTVLGLELVKKNGCDRYMKPLEPVLHRQFTPEEMFALGCLAVGGLVFLAFNPIPAVVIL